MEFAPIVVFAYDRINNLKKTIESLEECQLASESYLIIFSDEYDENKNNKDKVNEIRCFLECLKQDNKFLCVDVVNAPCHKGLAKSVIEGVSSVVEKYGNVIVVEDDLICSKSFLVYMNAALQHFKNDTRIWSISGYSFGLFSTRGLKSDIFLSRRGSSWGWATWNDRWETVDWDVTDYREFVSDKDRIASFNLCGEDMSKLLRMWKSGKTDSWAIRFDYAQFCQGKYTVFPKKSQVINIGLNGKGTNCDKSLLKIYKTYKYDLKADFNWNLIDDYSVIEKEKARAYSPKLIPRILIVFARWYSRLANVCCPCEE